MFANEYIAVEGMLTGSGTASPVALLYTVPALNTLYVTNSGISVSIGGTSYGGAEYGLLLWTMVLGGLTAQNPIQRLVFPGTSANALLANQAKTFAPALPIPGGAYVYITITGSPPTTTYCAADIEGYLL